MDKTRFKLLAQEDGHEITEMDESQAYHEIHPGAVYMHDGASYEITKMDLVSRTAYAIPFIIRYRQDRKRRVSCMYFRRTLTRGRKSVLEISM